MGNFLLKLRSVANTTTYSNYSFIEARVMKLPPVEGGFVKSEKDGKVPGKIMNRPREVSETDLYLLGAIEKLAYRADFMEKRLRKLEEMMYYVMAGNRMDQETCPDNFNRIGGSCYLFEVEKLDWKAANKRCHRYQGILTELDSIEKNQDVVAYIQTNKIFRGRDYWTGALNPGLLWIWSNSARPVSNTTGAVRGNGRCLLLAYDPSLRSYFYKGSDCAQRQPFICELAENTSSNELNRIARKLQI